MSPAQPLSSERTEAVERIAGAADAPVGLLCEHASERLPEGWDWPEADRWLVGTHWSVDLGAAELTTGLAGRLGAPAVLARFSRLLVDANRRLDDPTLFRDVAEGRSVHLNAALDRSERDRRIEGFYKPYHRAALELAHAVEGPLLLSVHTFTPSYEGQPRAMELGVLFEDHPAPSALLRARLAARGYDARLNEPWSGLDGLVESVQRHARAAGKVAIELEVRQDRATDPSWREAFLDGLADELLHLVRAIRGGV